MLNRAIPLALAVAMGGCANFFRKLPGPEEHARISEIEAFYREDVARAFQARDAGALASLFDPAISKPMTHAQILDWGRTFFAKHENVRFHADDVIVESLGHAQARVLLRYRVTTRGGSGDFGGTESDELVRRGGRWIVAAWEKLEAPPREP
jgi:hypothetical protein